MKAQFGCIQLPSKNAPKKVKHQSLSVKASPKFPMWGGVSSGGVLTAGLFFLYKNLTKELFVDILQGFLLPTAQALYENDWWLRQRNDPKHTSGAKNMSVLEWPSHSPDLNPIGNVWGHMKQKLCQKAITDVEEMKRERTKMCDTMTHNFLQITSLICQLESTPTLTDNHEAKLTGKNSQSVVQTLSFSCIITVLLVF